MNAVTEGSGHQCVGCAVSVCTTPAAPSPIPVPYPLMGTSAQGIADAPMRTKFGGKKIATVGSVLKTQTNPDGTKSVQIRDPWPPGQGTRTSMTEAQLQQSGFSGWTITS